MRKVLIILIIVLLLFLGYTVTAKGLEIGDFTLWSIKNLADSNENLEKRIEEINTMKDVEYPKKVSDLQTASNNMKSKKEEYLDYTNLSSDEQIVKAMQNESYAIEFLWTRIGNHATTQGVNLKFEIVSSATGAADVNDLNFTVQGSYIGITNFIYAIENDQELNFRIQSFKLLPYDGDILQGTFNVPNISIQGNTSTHSITQPEQANTTNENNKNQETTNTESTNNVVI